MMFRTLFKSLKNIPQKRRTLTIFEVGLHGNSACGYYDLPLNQGRYEMRRGEILRVYSHLYEEGLRVVFVQGREPLLRKDLPDILNDLTSLVLSISLITNGTTFTQGLFARLARHPLRFSVSLDHMNRQRYRAIRGADQLPVVLKGLGPRPKYPHPKYLTYLVSEINRDDNVNVIRFAPHHGIFPVLRAYYWDDSRHGKVGLTLHYQKATATAVFQEVLESNLVPKGYFWNYLQDNIRWLKDQGISSCDGERDSIAIDASGNVAPFLTLAHAGNLLSSPLSIMQEQLDHPAIPQVSNRSSCNMLSRHVVSSNLRHPLAPLQIAHSLSLQQVN